MLVVHGTRDQFSSQSQLADLQQCLASQIREGQVSFKAFNDADHFWAGSGAAMARHVAEFLMQS